MRLTTRTNLALRTLMVCAINAGRTVRKHEIAEACNASENHLAQVINTLSQLGYVNTTRGRHGGLQLARAPEEVRIGQVFRAFEAGVPFTECFEPEANTCPLTTVCRLRLALVDALEAFYGSLDRYTLFDMIDDNTGLRQLLEFPTAAPAAAVPCNRRAANGAA
ncbi:RrF2 family transcriptional regulator [Acidimangrovimonas pyrenivorans]|uniref:RrF2 family transcriptional regulator n=1 Tax=Acidimangrovimonas pyrenivorans TaxID=2030798 RepID=A0ABV7AC62_9RHOB